MHEFCRTKALTDLTKQLNEKKKKKNQSVQRGRKYRKNIQIKRQ